MDTSQLPLVFELREDPVTGLRKMFSNDETLKSFTILLDRIRSQATLNLKQRTELLFDVIFWKGEFEWLKKKLEIKLEGKTAELHIRHRNELGRVNEQMVTSHIKVSKDIEKLEGLLNVANKWLCILTDSFFVLQSTHKIIGKEQM